jgi:hypothetical protein
MSAAEPVSAPSVEPVAAAETVARAAAAADAAQTELEAAIVAYRLTGASMAAIAAVAGYSAPGIMGVLRRHGVR